MIGLFIDQLILAFKMGRKGIAMSTLTYIILSLIGLAVVLSIVLFVGKDKGGEALEASESLLNHVVGKD
ncbi:MAG: hypothetical protein ACLFTH_00115 [Candidatus Woesearchaeota archaeon]